MKTRILAAGVAAVAALVLSATAFAVVGGAPDNGRHPYAVGLAINTSIGGELCSGVLVNATTVVTAAHCLRGDFQVGQILVSSAAQFAPQAAGAAYFVHPDYAVGSTGLSTSDRNDVAVVKLTNPLPGPYAQLPTAGYTDTLKNNTQVDVVGYGLPTPGLKTSAPAKIIPGGGKTAPWFLKISAGTECQGDSGGPIVQSGTDIALAISSYGPAANCAAVGYAQRLDTPEVLGFIARFS